MIVEITGRHVSITETLKKHAEDKLSHVIRHAGDIISAHVITPNLDFAYALYAVTVLGMAIVVIFKEPSGRKVILKSVPWLIGCGLHLAAGFGLFYVNPGSRRKWLYPLFFLLAIALLIVRWVYNLTLDEPIGVVILVAAGLAGLGYLFGFVDVSLAIRRRMQNALYSRKLG